MPEHESSSSLFEASADTVKDFLSSGMKHHTLVRYAPEETTQQELRDSVIKTQWAHHPITDLKRVPIERSQ